MYKYLLTFLIFFFSLTCFGETTPTTTFNGVEANWELDRLIQKAQHEKPTIRHVQRTIDEINLLAIKAKKCVTDNTILLSKINQRLSEIDSTAAIGKAKPTDELKYLDSKKKTLSTELSACRLFILKSDELLNQYNKTMQQLVAQQLLQTQGSIFTNIIESPALTSQFIENFDFKQLVEDLGLDIFNTASFIIFIILLSIGTLASIKIRDHLKIYIERYRFNETLSDRLKQAFLYILKRYITPLFIFTIATIFIIFCTLFYKSSLDLFYLSLSGLLYILYLFIVDFFFYPPPPARGFSDLPSNIAKMLNHRLKLLGTLSVVGFFFYIFINAQTIPEGLEQLTRTIFITFLATNLIIVIAVVNKLPKLLYHFRFARPLITIVLIAALSLIIIAEWMGYHGLAIYILRIITVSLLTGFGAWLCTKIITAAELGQANTPHRWQQFLRRHLGLKVNETWTEIILLRAAIYLIIWGGFLLLTLRGWGLGFNYFKMLMNSLIHGFQIGNMTIIPSRVLGAFLFFVLLCLLTRFLRAQVRKQQTLQMEYGSREALASIVGYLGFALSLLFALLIAGVNFAGLAIIAGALSVGIGFGLQNIVNNFISGIILLVEQPIKQGDRIVVADTEGQVSRISIRSTRIHTGQGTDVIVPNSELITKQVTNMMLHDTHYTIINKVGVAYNSNLELVKKVLLDVAYKHPEVIKDNEEHLPVVYLKHFGESSIDFELQSMIRNVNVKSKVLSELNFDIAKIFAKNAIEFAYPHREISVTNWPKNTTN